MTVKTRLAKLEQQPEIEPYKVFQCEDAVDILSDAKAKWAAPWVGRYVKMFGPEVVYGTLAGEDVMTIKNRLLKLERLPKVFRMGWRDIAHDLDIALWRILGSKGPRPTMDDVPDTRAEWDAMLDKMLAILQDIN